MDDPARQEGVQLKCPTRSLGANYLQLGGRRKELGKVQQRRQHFNQAWKFKNNKKRKQTNNDNKKKNMFPRNLFSSDGENFGEATTLTVSLKLLFIKLLRKHGEILALQHLLSLLVLQNNFEVQVKGGISQIKKLGVVHIPNNSVISKFSGYQRRPVRLRTQLRLFLCLFADSDHPPNLQGCFLFSMAFSL